MCVNNSEPILLVGETGNGKTSVVQVQDLGLYIAQQTLTLSLGCVLSADRLVSFV